MLTAVDRAALIPPPDLTKRVPVAAAWGHLHPLDVKQGKGDGGAFPEESTDGEAVN